MNNGFNGWETGIAHVLVPRPPSTVDGPNANRNTSGSFTSLSQYCTMRQAAILLALYWDIRNAGTYTLTIDGAVMGTQTFAGAATNSLWNLPGPGIWVGAGQTLLIKFTAGGALTWTDYNGGNYLGPQWTGGTLYYDTSAYSIYTIPMRLVAWPLRPKRV